MLFSARPSKRERKNVSRRLHRYTQMKSKICTIGVISRRILKNNLKQRVYKMLLSATPSKRKEKCFPQITQIYADEIKNSAPLA
ncbi:hypothetical protein ASF92_02525 [Pedobacter sp. Leaf176]|nr:hypothetical protein ASF92_02525 [Pedobacter sp. Leaf176]